MNKIEVIKLTLSKTAGRSGLVMRKYSPEILVSIGIAGIVTSTVMACKATLKADEVLQDTKEQLNKIKSVKESVTDKDTLFAVEYTDKDYKKDLVIVYTQGAVKFIKLYGPAVTLGVASIGCIFGAHNIMKKRNVALMAAYKTIEQSFNNYRNRVVEEFGEDKDRQYRHGVHEETVTVIEEDADGKKKKVKKTIEVADPNKISQYAKFFDESCDDWSKNPEYNLLFLRHQQNYANDLLHSRGHVFLNEVYDTLGIPRTKDGAIVGWVLGHGDDFIDFGIYDFDNVRGRDFVNGYERSILLDFNVHGVIYDLI